MRKKLIYTCMISTAILLGSSCSDKFLDQEPYGSLAASTAIKSEADLSASANGMYNSLRAVGAFGRTIPLLGDLLADNVYVSAQNSGRYLIQSAYTSTVSSTEVADLWNNLYTSILRANTIINTTLPGSVTVNQLRGEALAIRALCHLELVKHFAAPYTVAPASAGVPIVTVFDQNASPSRNTVTEVYNQINADLTAAFGLMTVVKTSAFVNKYAAKAIQSRVYLYMGDYIKARDAALEVVSSGGYTLVTPTAFASYWANPASRTDKVETIFEIGLDGTNNNGTTALSYIYDPAGYGDMLATASLYGKYAATDVRRALIKVGVRGSSDNPAYIVNKYSNSSNLADKDDVKVIRYAEVLLTLAEAYARTGNDALALTTLNQVTAARSAAAYTSAGAALIEDILTERQKELAFEGFRYYDFMRLNRVVTRTTQHPAAARNIATDDFHRIFPIPQAERDANKNIAQNPGYPQ